MRHGARKPWLNDERTEMSGTHSAAPASGHEDGDPTASAPPGGQRGAAAAGGNAPAAPTPVQGGSVPAGTLPLRLFRADLHIHTALSPCGGDEMTPPAIVHTALARGLDMIAVCDHNTAGNTRAVQEAGAAHGLSVLAGMELASVEEVHVVGLFPDADHAERAAGQIHGLLSPADAHYYSFFGEQPVMAADGCQVGSETVALALATPLELSEAVALIHDCGGLAVAAHVDRKSFSVFSQLGFFPPDAGFDALEVSKWLPSDSPRLAEFVALGLPLVGSSDSHYLEEIGQGCTQLVAEAPTFAELALALAGTDGRSTARVGRDAAAGGGAGLGVGAADGPGAGSGGHA
jgi:3',5'-nucleoside bisphosphate phosphatase